jgi:hypothetical protein
MGVNYVTQLQNTVTYQTTVCPTFVLIELE